VPRTVERGLTLIQVLTVLDHPPLLLGNELLLTIV